MPDLTTADHIEIHDLYAKYCYATDHGDGPGRAALFTSDGTFKSSATNHEPLSRDAIAERAKTGGNNGRRHLMMNVVATASSEGANGRGYVIVLEYPQNVGQGGFAPMIGYTGIYVDTLVKTAEGWRFKTRHLLKDQEDISPFKRGAPAAAMPWS